MILQPSSTEQAESMTIPICRRFIRGRSSGNDQFNSNRIFKMKPTPKIPNKVSVAFPRRVSICGVVALLAVFFGINGGTANGQVREPDNDSRGGQVLTRGPVHEAFAGIVSYNPEPGLIVVEVPPEPIDEVPPDVRPEGDNITWIPGYWAWDDERSDFLWISGTWRALPPGREWITGYWAPTTEGNQWTSGYWADSTAPDTTYLPRPPETLEAGPNIAAPSSDYGWTPGCWVWRDESYAWRPGYWDEGRSDWEWIPSHYVWTPRGYIFVDGYWDYTLARRGVLFAPVYFESNRYSHREYRYSPAIVIDLVALVEHLFLRPRYNHYYFGDYYASSYDNRGFYSSYAFQSYRHGYDPVYSHERWEHRDDHGWEERFESSSQYRRNHESARPPRTWNAQRELGLDSDDSRQHQLRMAAPLGQFAGEKDSRVRFQPVVENERRQLAQRGQDVQKFRDHRRESEGRAFDNARERRATDAKSANVERFRSPIVGKESGKLSKTEAPPSRPRREPISVEKDQPRSPQDRNPQMQKPTNQQDPPRTMPDKGEPRPPQPQDRTPQTEKPKGKQDPPRAMPDKGEPRPPQPQNRTPQTEKPKGKQDPPRTMPDKGEPRPPQRTPQTEKPKGKQDPPRAMPDNKKEDTRGKKKQPEAKPPARHEPAPPEEESKPKSPSSQDKKGKRK